MVNIDSWLFPERGQQLILRKGHQLAGNWLEPNRQPLPQFAPDLIVFAPHRRESALTLPLDMVKKIPTILWALYPDYLTGWDREKNEHMDGFLSSVREMLPYFRVHMANSIFTKELLEARVPSYTFEVCYLGIDTKGIEEATAGKRRGQDPSSVLWHHRWATDKNLQEALDIVLRLARRHPNISFYLGRKEDWDEPFWVPQSLRDYYAAVSGELDALGNVCYVPRFETQRQLWEFLGGVDIAFSCSYHETFGITMLEKAYAEVACVVPNRVVYPEVMPGAMVVPPSEVEAGIEALLTDPALWTRVAKSSRASAAQYDVAITADRLLDILL